MLPHVTGTRFPKDYYFRAKKQLIGKYPLVMQDVFLISISFYEGESIQEKLNSYKRVGIKSQMIILRNLTVSI